MKNRFKIGCFYTEDSPYEQVWQQCLKPSLEKFSLDYIVKTAPNYGNWYKNVAEKPRIIGEILESNIEKNGILVFLDVDATIEQYPILFEEILMEYEIGYHILQWNAWYGYKDNPSKTELLTGTMFFRPTTKVKDLCKEWYETAKETMLWEQKVLASIIDSHGLNIYKLPLEYCYITSLPNGDAPLIKLDPVITHHQVSREFKKKKLC
jgi:hypothetical protein